MTVDSVTSLHPRNCSRHVVGERVKAGGSDAEQCWPIRVPHYDVLSSWRRYRVSTPHWPLDGGASRSRRPINTQYDNPAALRSDLRRTYTRRHRNVRPLNQWSIAIRQPNHRHVADRHVITELTDRRTHGQTATYGRCYWWPDTLAFVGMTWYFIVVLGNWLHSITFLSLYIQLYSPEYTLAENIDINNNKQNKNRNVLINK